MPNDPTRRLLLAAAGLAVSACTTTYRHSEEQSQGAGAVVERPLTDVSLMREEPPELLKTAAAEPYRLSEPFDCEAARAEIAELRAVLGPDLDERTDDEEGAAAGRLATNAIAGLVSLPFRGVVRWISGAERREKVLAEAILAGMVRRGYLKGAMRAGCESPVED